MSDYNPDELVLSKQDVMDLLQAVENYWNQNKVENILYLSALKIIKTGVRVTPEKAVKKLWNTFLRFVKVVEYENGLKRALNNNESWADTMKKIKINLAEDGLDNAMRKYTDAK